MGPRENRDPPFLELKPKCPQRAVFTDKREGMYPQKSAASLEKAGQISIPESTTKWSMNVSHDIYPLQKSHCKRKYCFKTGITKDVSDISGG